MLRKVGPIHPSKINSFVGVIIPNVGYIYEGAALTGWPAILDRSKSSGERVTNWNNKIPSHWFSLHVRMYCTMLDFPGPGPRVHHLLLRQNSWCAAIPRLSQSAWTIWSMYRLFWLIFPLVLISRHLIEIYVCPIWNCSPHRSPTVMAFFFCLFRFGSLTIFLNKYNQDKTISFTWLSERIIRSLPACRPYPKFNLITKTSHYYQSSGRLGYLSFIYHLRQCFAYRAPSSHWPHPFFKCYTFCDTA